MRSTKVGLLALIFMAGCAPQAGPPAETSNAVLFEGARLIVGDGSAAVESSAFLVEDGRFTAVGAAGAIDLPAGGVRVDLAGKTVMPAIVDLHYHPGYLDVTGMTSAAENYTRENLVDHVNRLAYYGIAAGLGMGTDHGEAPFQLRQETIPGAALFRTAGAGIAMPNAGPGAAHMKPIAYGVTTEDEARGAVRELAGRNVDMVKIWVDDRGGTVEKLTPELYGAVIDEAHSQGLRVAAHIFTLADAKGLLRAGLDGFAHGVRDMDIDDEFMELLAERSDVFLIPNLPNSGLRTEDHLAFLSETLPATEVERMRDQLANRTQDGPSASFQIQARNLMRMNAAGVRIGMGTDGSGAGWNAHEEMADMVAAGMTPMEVIAAATSTSAEILGLDGLGAVANGKSADFIVLNANPLDDINNTREIDSVYLRGDGVDRNRLRIR